MSTPAESRPPNTAAGDLAPGSPKDSSPEGPQTRDKQGAAATGSPDSEWDLAESGSETAPAGARNWAFLFAAIFLNLFAFGVLGFIGYKVFSTPSEEASRTSPETASVAAGRAVGGGVMQLPQEQPVFCINKVKRYDKVTAEYTSIGEALSNCPPGIVLYIRDQEVYEEQIIHGRDSGKTSIANIKIVAEPDQNGRTAVLRLPADAAPGSPLVAINRADGFTIRGLTLDGRGQSDDLVVIQGNCHEALFESVRLQGFKRTGVKFINCSGMNSEKDEIQPIRLRDVSFEAVEESPTATAVAFEGDNKDVTVQRCRFLGHFAPPIRIDGAARQCQIDQNIFFGRDNGAGSPASAAVILGKDSANAAALELTIANNTFCGYENALAFWQTPAAGSSITLNSNLFFEVTKGIGTVERIATLDLLREMVHGDGNVRDPKSPLGAAEQWAKAKIAEMAFEMPTNRQNQSTWLRYSLKSPLAKAGLKGAYVGAQLPVTKE
jgi:hypothetical protein